MLGFSHYNEFSEGLVSEFINAAIYCWGSAPFNEFKICTSCKRIHSVEEVYSLDVPLLDESIVKYIPDNFPCTDCGSATLNMYDKKELMENLKKYFEFNVYMVLSFTEEWRISAFGVMVKKSIQDIVDYDFSTRPNSYNKDQLCIDIYKKLFRRESSESKEVLCLQNIYVSPSERWKQISLKLIGKMFSHFLPEEGDIPAILETKIDSNFYSISRCLGFENIWDFDKYWYIVQGIPQVSDLVNINQISHNIRNQLSYFNKESSYFLNKNPNLLAPKFYK